MNYIKLIVLICVVFSFCGFSSFVKEKNEIILFNTEEGKKLFNESQYHEAYWRIASNFEAQEKENTCGVASSVIALNALDAEGAKKISQNNFFSDKISGIVSPFTVDQRGMKMSEMKSALEAYNVKTDLYFWDSNNEATLRSMLKSSLSDPNKVVIALFYRPALGLPGAGHFSPIGAYDQKTDSVLIMDVAGDKPPPEWVSMDNLLASMKPIDSKWPRGFIVVSKS